MPPAINPHLLMLNRKAKKQSILFDKSMANLRMLALAYCMLVLLGQKVRAESQHACDGSDASIQALPFCNRSLAIGDRVKDLISRLTVEEKITQLVNGAAAIARLGIPSYQWWQEALHGVAKSPGVRFGGSAPSATSFPMPITTAASFNTSLFYKIGQVVSTEARAMHNLGQAGLTFWSPNINIFRDPRWGRGQETPGEDPILSSKFAIYYVRGLQEVDSAGSPLLKVSACCKHLTAYDVDNWLGTDRYHFDAKVTQQDLDDTYNVPFESCVKDGHVSSVMCSYNRVNGVPTCADRHLLTDTVRNAWGLDGYIVSDCDAVQVMYDNTGYTNSAGDAVAVSLLAGLDLNCGTFVARHASEALQGGKITELDLNRALTNLFTIRMRLGLFDGNPASQQYGNLGAADVCTKENQQLALEAALQGVVLLKNDGMLPLSRTKIVTLGVIGPNANATQTMIGNYEGIPCNFITPLQGLQSYTKVRYSPGCGNVACQREDFINQAIDTAAKVDAVVLVVGLDQGQEQETFDRTNLLLPGYQTELVTAVAGASAGPVVLVIMSAGPVDISFAKINPHVSAILWIGYPGQAGGAALAQVIFGDYNPGGRLPVTWYPQDFTKVSMLDMRMRPDNKTGYPGRTYRFYTGPTIYQFGDGISYTTYTHQFSATATNMTFSNSKIEGCSSGQQKPLFCSQLSVENQEVCDRLKYKVSLSVNNGGASFGSHTVLLFSHPPAESVSKGAPQKQLLAFERVHLEAGSTTQMTFSINPCEHLSTVDESGKRSLHAGIHTLSAGKAMHFLSITAQ